MARIALAACAITTVVMFACGDAGTSAGDPGQDATCRTPCDCCGQVEWVDHRCGDDVAPCGSGFCDLWCLGRDDVRDPASDVRDAADPAGDPGPTCDGEPREGCPCSPDDPPCCLGLAEGLECGIALPLPRRGAPSRVWARFLDCGCDPGPDCEGWDLYPMCGTATR